MNSRKEGRKETESQLKAPGPSRRRKSAERSFDGTETRENGTPGDS